MNNNNNMWQKYQNIPPQQSGQQGAVPQPQQPAEQNGQQGAVPQPQQPAEQNGQQVEKQNFGVNSDADVSSQYGAYKPRYNYAALTKPDKNATGVIIGIIVFLVVLLLVGIVGFAITSGDDIEKGTQEFFDNLNSDNSSNGQYSDNLSGSGTADGTRQTRSVSSRGDENKTITFVDPQGDYSLDENDTTASDGNYYGDNYYYYYNPSDGSSVVISFDYGTAKEGVKFQREYYQSNNQSCDTYTWNTNFGEATALSITDTKYNVNETVSFVQLAESTYAYISLASTDDFDSQRKAAEEIINSMQVQ
mgnify:CR=1 FL=1